MPPRHVFSRRCWCGPVLAWLLAGAVYADEPTYIPPPEPRADPNNRPMPEFNVRDSPPKPVTVFYPPIPPGMGDTTPSSSVAARGVANAPEEMSLYIDEPFYAVLAARLDGDDFTMRLRHPLDHYRIGRDNLLVELRAELERTADFSREDRLAALEMLAKKQAPALAELEQTAEDLRDAFSKSTYDWSAKRVWRLGDGKNAYTDKDEAQAMRGMAYFQDGLSLAQRRLLREAANDILGAQPRRRKDALRDNVVAFLPEGAQVRIVAKYDTPLATKLAEFQQLKTALKEELRAAVAKEDNRSLALLRTSAFQRLAEKQAPRIAQLEELAEEIRRAYDATKPARPRTPISPLPPVLSGRIAAVIDLRRALHRDTMAEINELNARYPKLPATLIAELRGNRLVTKLIPYGGASDPESAKGREIEKFRLEFAAIMSRYDDRYEELSKEVEAVRVEVAAFLGTSDPVKIGAVIGVTAQHALIKSTYDAFAEYRAAALEPGLSPAQRRLLFGAGLARLDIALPSAVAQPTASPTR